MTRALAFLLAAAFVVAGLQTYRLDAAKLALATAQRDAAAAQAAAELDARTREYQTTVAFNKVQTDTGKAIDNAKKSSAVLVADLRAGNRRLRDDWSGCSADRVSIIAAAAVGADAAEQRRADSAGRIIGAADACDAQVKGLQALLIAERAPPGKTDGKK